MSRVRQVCLGFVASLLLAAPLIEAHAAPDKKVVQALLKQQYDNLAQFSCRYKTEGGDRLYFGRYAQSGGRKRAVAENLNIAGGPGEDVLIKDGLRYGLVPGSLNISDASQTGIGSADVLDMALLKCPGPGVIAITLTDLLDLPLEELKIAEASDGSGDIIVKARHSGGTIDCTVEFVLSQAHNFYPKRLRTVADKGRVVSVLEVMAFGEPASGVYFPTKVSSSATLTYRDTETKNITIHFTDITVGRPIPESEFQQKYAPGILVMDSVKQVVDRIGPDGSRIRTEQQYGLPPPLGPAVGLTGPTATQTIIEPTPTWYYLVLSLIGVMLLVGAGWLVLRRSSP